MNGNRYFLMMTDHAETKVFRSDEEYKKFLVDYSKNNKNPKNKYVYGNFNVLNDNKNSTLVKYTVYKKITESYDLDRIDRFLTEQVEDQNNLKERFKTIVDGGTGKVYIGYMYNGQAKTLPIFYKKDKDYVMYESLKKIILDNILEPTFLAKLWTDKKLNNSDYRKKIEFYLERIQVEYGKYTMKKVDNAEGIKKAVDAFIEAWCTKDDELNQRYIRELGSIIKNIKEGKVEEKKQKKENSEIKGKKEDSKVKKIKREDPTKYMDPLF